ncbi:MAG TPA: hypothetical protein VKZ18_29700 [Polyangia bacterium]|nr:hypothetical protein [Polyangia bacterium]
MARLLEMTWLSILIAGCAGHAPARPSPPPAQPAADPRWESFWRAHGVSPAPPPGFLESSDPLPATANLTDGALDDETVLRWIVADLRRGRGDEWASCHLRLDVANADVFGPPGLNGTGRGISDQLDEGVVAVACGARSVVEEVAVVAIPKAVQGRMPEARLTDFVIVTRRRSTGLGLEQTFYDGRRVALPSRHAAGALTWQLDTGNFREDPVVGALWYQADGWSCGIDGSSPLDVICGLLAPAGSRKPPPDPLRASN